MIEQEKEAMVYRIISGEIYIQEYNFRLLAADARTKYRASCLYNSIIDDNRFNDWLDENICLAILIENKLVDSNVEHNLKALSTRVEELKVELYESFFDSKKKEQTKKILKMVYQKQNETIMSRHSLDHLTLKGFAEMVRQQYLIYSTLVDAENKLVWPTTDDVDIRQLDNIMLILRHSLLSHSQLREIARNDPWRSYWGVSKNPFDCPIPNLTDEQRMLVTFSKMYDNIQEHPQSPPIAILEDDDALDGWIIKQKKDREKEKEQELLDNTFKGLKEADEVFVIANNQEDIDKINSLNNTQSKMVKQQRESVIKSKGKAVDLEFPDRMMALQQQSNQKFMDTVKGK